MAEVKSSKTLSWAQDINSELATKPMYYPEKQFKTRIDALDTLERQTMLRSMRLDRDFYKKVLEEPYRVKNPSSYRYLEASIRIEILNKNGKTLKLLCDEQSTASSTS